MATALIEGGDAASKTIKCLIPLGGQAVPRWGGEFRSVNLAIQERGIEVLAVRNYQAGAEGNPRGNPESFPPDPVPRCRAVT